MTDTTTLPLFAAEHTAAPAIPPRPRRTDPAVLDAAAERLWGYVRPWLSAIVVRRPELLEECKRDVRDNIGSSDGYQFARSLDDRGWEPDAALVAILDHARQDITVAITGAVTAWVQVNRITTPLPAGTRVRAPVNGNVIEGRLSAQRNPAMGYYAVMCDDGDTPCVNAEDVVPVEGKAER